jgi:hypothetical protein
MREWTASNTPAVMQWGAGQAGPAPPRHSTCQLECDACVEDILNKGEVREPPDLGGPNLPWPFGDCLGRLASRRLGIGKRQLWSQYAY